MPKLTDTQTRLVDEHFVLIAGLALLRDDVKNEHGLQGLLDVQDELRRAFVIITPYTSKKERIENRGRLSRSAVAELEGALPVGEPMSPALRRRVIELGATYEWANQGEEVESQRMDAAMNLATVSMDAGAEQERRDIAAWLRTKGHDDLAQEVLDQKFPGGRRAVPRL